MQRMIGKPNSKSAFVPARRFDSQHPDMQLNTCADRPEDRQVSHKLHQGSKTHQAGLLSSKDLSKKVLSSSTSWRLNELRRLSILRTCAGNATLLRDSVFRSMIVPLTQFRLYSQVCFLVAFKNPETNSLRSPHCNSETD